MKKSLLLFAVAALVLTACKTSNPPTDNSLHGMWYYTSSDEDGTGTSLLFDEDGLLTYRWVPDITQSDVIDWGGMEKSMTYTTANNKLCISYADALTEIYPQSLFEYTTDYTIQGNKLTINRFSWDGERFAEVSLVAGEEVPKAELSTQNKTRLNAIFTPDNPYFHSDKVNEYNTCIVRSIEELQAMCPENVSLPEIDFSKECIVFSYIQVASVNYGLIGTTLYHNPLNDLYEYRIKIQRCSNCYDAIDHRVAYSVHTIPGNSVRYMTAIPLFKFYWQ